MKFSYNWLKEISDSKLSPEKMAELLMMHAFEVEGMEKIGRGLENVMVGEILEIHKHSNADRLQIAKVDVGDKKLDIVCGATNIFVGAKVPVALVGAKLPNGMTIEEREVRGVKSFGMICAEDELGLGFDHQGVMILGKELKVGEKFAGIMGLEDVALSIDVLANRAHDALSHVGMAREISVLNGKKPEYDYDGLILPKKKSKELDVEIRDKELCPRYIGAVIESVVVKESPRWLKLKLEACGLRPINNVVDVTNYVMLELGQPLHAFDFNKISAENLKSQKVEIIVRRAKEGEAIKLLDGSVKKLTEDDLLITNSEKALALAGVMGGEDSGISEKTSKVVLEAANFNASSIRKARMRHGLQTDASIRFEKDIDPDLCEKAMVRAIELVSELTGGNLEGVKDNYPKRISSSKVKMRLSSIRKLLGENIALGKVKKILTLLDMKVGGTSEKLSVTVPTFRLDIETSEDLIEEVGRIYGYEKIKSRAPETIVKAATPNPLRIFERKTKQILAGQGFSEVRNYSFYGENEASLARLETMRHLEIDNPQNPEQALLRVSLIPGVLKNIRENLKRYDSFRMFEAGRVYRPGGNSVDNATNKSNGGVLPDEPTYLVGAVVLPKTKKDSKKEAESFFELKGQVDALLQSLGMENFYYSKLSPALNGVPADLWHQGRSAEIKIENQNEALGFIGEINPLVLADFDIHTRVAMFEFDLEKMREAASREKIYEVVSKYPVVVRDISMFLNNETEAAAAEIIAEIKKTGGELVKDAEVFDVFSMERENTTSLAVHIVFGSQERTLASDEVDELTKRIVERLEDEFEVVVRI